MNLGDQWPPRCAAAPFESRRSARRPPSCWPAAFAGSLPVTLLGGFEFFALSLLKLALALLGLGDLFPIFLQRAAVALLNRLPPFGVGALPSLARSQTVFSREGGGSEILTGARQETAAPLILQCVVAPFRNSA
jgi:hypothetical protein